MNERETESVWEYPRPPRLETSHRTIAVVHSGITLARTSKALRVLETSHPPTYYIPEEEIRMELLVPNANRTVCEWKGVAGYFDLVIGDTLVEGVAWTYQAPAPAYGELAGHLAFYAHKMDGCFVDDEKVMAQEGSFYGGWITSHVTGPFKGASGTGGW